MYKYTLFCCIILGGNLLLSTSPLTWTVIGAGPAGIVTVSTLLDNNVPASHIHWIDPTFTAGRLGACYSNVPANSSVADFLAFFRNSPTFRACLEDTDALTELTSQAATAYPYLHTVTRPLRELTASLAQIVHTHGTYVQRMTHTETGWHVMCMDGSSPHTDHVVLATGAQPRMLNYAAQEVIPIDIALDKDKLAQWIHPEDTVAVVGSAHSAILLLKHLYELSVRSIINLHTKPLIYAYNDGTYTIRPASGLKGDTARWAHEVLEKEQPDAITRVYNTERNRWHYIPQCDKVIYAAGFTRNPIPTYEGTQACRYDGKTGIIAPGMFGIGIAFPEQQMDSLGNREYLVGVNSFQSYAQRIIPYWMSQPAVPEQSKECMPTLILDW